MPALSRMTKSPMVGTTRGEGADRRFILGRGTHNLMRTCLNAGWSVGENQDGPRLEITVTRLGPP